MKIEVQKATVTFKSSEPYFELEESGKKCNTARELSCDEIDKLPLLTHIKIISMDGQQHFTRELTNVCVAHCIILAVPDRKLVIFSWKQTHLEMDK